MNGLQQISDFVPVFRAGAQIGMITAVGAGLGGMLIHFVSRIFHIMGGG